MKKILVFIAITCIACVKPSNDTISESEYKELLQQTILVIPDSLLTARQIELKVKLCDFLFQNIVVEENCLKLTVDKLEFEQEQIPVVYYDVIKYQLEESSTGIKMLMDNFPDKPFNIEEDLEECKEHYWKTERPTLLKKIKP